MTSGAKLLDDYAQFRNQLDAELLKTERVVSSHAHVARCLDLTLIALTELHENTCRLLTWNKGT